MKVTLSNTIGSVTELKIIKCQSTDELIEILNIIQPSLVNTTNDGYEKAIVVMVKLLFEKFNINQDDVKFSWIKNNDCYPCSIVHGKSKFICEDYESLVIALYECNLSVKEDS